ATPLLAEARCLRFAWKTQEAFAHDVALDLRGSTPNRFGTREEERRDHLTDLIGRTTLGPHRRWPGTGLRADIAQETRRAKDVEGELHGVAVHLRPEHLVRGAECNHAHVLGALHGLGQAAQTIDPKNLNLRVVQRETLADDRISDRTGLLGGLDHQIVFLFETTVPRRRGHAALMAER